MKIFLKLLPLIARCHPKNWRPSRWDYPQLWYCMPHRHFTFLLDRQGRIQIGAPKILRDLGQPAYQYPEGWHRSKPYIHPIGYWLKPLLQWLCGRLTGHEISETEWGYGGGSMADCNCRWCDHVIQVPLAESPPPHPVLRSLVSDNFGHDPDTGQPNLDS